MNNETVIEFSTAAVLVRSVERSAGGRRLKSRGRIKIRSLKITEK